jgi:hypothetical protein
MNLSEVQSGRQQIPICPYCPLLVNSGPFTACVTPVHDHRKRGGSDGFLDHAMLVGRPAFAVRNKWFRRKRSIKPGVP